MGLFDVIIESRTLGDEAAEELLEAAGKAELAKREPDRASVANLKLHLSQIQERLGAFDRAEANVREAFRLYRRGCGTGDPRTRHAKLQIADVLRRAGKTREAILAYQLYEPRTAARPAWLLLILEELHREIGHVRRADGALDDALAGARGCLEDPMTYSGTLIQAAQRLAASGRLAEAKTLLDDAIAALEEVAAGRRFSISARVPAQVLGEVRAALLGLGG